MLKTGTHLLYPFLEKLTGKTARWIPMDFPYQNCSEQEFYQYLNHAYFVPVYLHRKPVPIPFVKEVLKSYKRKNQFWASHIPYSQTIDIFFKNNNIKVFHIKRDLRDFVISGAKFFGSNPACPFPYDWYRDLSFDDKVFVMIVGTEWWNSTRWHAQSFIGWHKSSNCLTLEFEKLVGPNGGGCTEQEHLRELQKIANYLGIVKSDEELKRLFNEVFGTGPTFNQGKTKVWQTQMSETNKEWFKGSAGDLLIQMGYETSNDW
jgi:hypothetical protein